MTCRVPTCDCGQSSPRSAPSFRKQERRLVHSEVCEVCEVCPHDHNCDRLVGLEPTHPPASSHALALLSVLFPSPFAATCNFPSPSKKASRGFETRNPGVCSQRSPNKKPDREVPGSTHQWGVIEESGRAVSVIVFPVLCAVCCFCAVSQKQWASRRTGSGRFHRRAAAR